MTRNERMLKAALTYAGAGMPVFPLRGKNPAIKGGRGLYDATADLLEVRRQWMEYPGSNIGYAIPAGLVVIDLDKRPTVDADAEFDSLRHKLGVLPATRECLTGSGGRHVYFSVPVGFVAKGKLAPGIDLKAQGGYVVLPPSQHPTTHAEYSWDGLEGFKAPIAALPAPWVEFCRRPAEATADGPAKDEKLAKLFGILNGCAWVRHCHDDAATLTEPDWYALLGVLAHVEQGLETAQLWSKPYPTYSAPATAKKFLHAQTAAGATTCRHVADTLSWKQTYCDHCRHWGKITSPVQLGHSRRRREAVARMTSKPHDVKQPAATDCGLSVNGKGNPYPNLSNAVHLFETLPAWGGRLVYDEFADAIFVQDGTPGPAGKLDDRRLLEILVWLQKHLWPTVNESANRSAVELVARRHVIHPRREGLRREPWDGVKRAQEGFFKRYFGAMASNAQHIYADDAELYWDQAAVLFGVSAVARIERPGCRVEQVLVLEGATAPAKSRALEILAGGYLGTMPARLDTRDAAEGLRGCHLVEIAESAVSDVAVLRAFLARRNDRQRTEFWRPSFGRLQQNIERQCVFVVTMAEAAPLFEDFAGAWRFWPVVCGKIDHGALAKDAPQLWAEWQHLYQSGAKWWPAADVESLFQKEQAARAGFDPLAERVRQYAQLHPLVSLSQMLETFNVPLHQQAGLVKRIVKTLQRLGFRAEAQDDGNVAFRNPQAAQLLGIVQ